MAPKIVDVTYDDVPAVLPNVTPSQKPVPKKIVDVGPGPSSSGGSGKQVVRGLYVATPCYGCQMTAQFMVSLMQLQALGAQRGIHVFCDFIGNESLITRARCVLTARFLKSEFSHLLFIDADISFNPNDVFKLLDADKDIVTAIYPKKAIDWAEVDRKLQDPGCKEPVTMMGVDFNLNLATQKVQVENGLVEALDAATGFFLTKRGVLEHVARHYEKDLLCVNDLPGDRSDPGYPETYVAMWDCMIDPVTKRYLSEDYAFSRRAQALGYKVYADITVPLCHIGNYTFNGDIRERFTMAYVA
jgi:hypothetical protein